MCGNLVSGAKQKARSLNGTTGLRLLSGDAAPIVTEKGRDVTSRDGTGQASQPATLGRLIESAR